MKARRLGSLVKDVTAIVIHLHLRWTFFDLKFGFILLLHNKKCQRLHTLYVPLRDRNRFNSVYYFSFILCPDSCHFVIFLFLFLKMLEVVWFQLGAFSGLGSWRELQVGYWSTLE